MPARFLIIATVVCTAQLIAQDRINLTDGTVAQGTVVGLHAEGVLLKTDWGSTLIKWDRLVIGSHQMASATALPLEGDDQLTVKLTDFDGQTIGVEHALFPSLRIPVTDLSAAPKLTSPQTNEEMLAEATAAAEEAILEPKDWNGSVALLGSFRSGNTNSNLFSLTANAQRQWAADRFTASAGFAYGETEDELTASNALARAKWDHFYDEDFYSYGLAEAEWDDIKNLNLRALVGIGAGINVWRGEGDNRSLDIEAGINALYQDFSTEDSSDFEFAGRFGLVYRDVFFEDVLFTENLDLLVPIPDAGGYILRSRTTLEMALSESWSLQNVLEVEYQGDPRDDNKSLDLKLLIGLNYSF